MTTPEMIIQSLHERAMEILPGAEGEYAYCPSCNYRGRIEWDNPQFAELHSCLNARRALERNRLTLTHSRQTVKLTL